MRRRAPRNDEKAADSQGATIRIAEETGSSEATRTAPAAVFDVSRTASRTFHSLRRGGLVLSLAVGLTVVSAATAQAASTRAPEPDRVVPSRAAASERAVIATAARTEEDGTPLPRSVAIAIKRANTSLTTAQAHLHHRRYARALQSLGALRVNVSKAHRAGMAQIGAPPSDPESDDPPGPGSVIAVLNLEHRVAVGLLGPFNGLKPVKVVRALRATLSITFTNRDRMLNRVIALPPEGAGADYADGMADTLGIYANEVNSYTTALKKYPLSAAGRLALQNSLALVSATRAKVDKAFGGGE